MGAPVKKPRKASSLSQMLPTGKRMDLDHPVPDFAGDKLASKAGGTSSVSGSRTTSKISPGRFPNTASRTAGSSRKPATGQPPSNAPTALKPDNARDNESKRSALNESNSRRKSSGNGSTKTGLGTWLGSLSRFMDTRSMSQNERLLVGLPADPETPRSTQSGQSPSSYMERLETIKADNSPSGSSFTWGSQPNSPARSALATNLVLFLSTKLLRTHLPLVMYMEGLSAPPKLMFRDYDAIVYPPRAGAAVPDQPSTGISDPESQLPEEADIIISPNAGIMLTTTHDLTQRYLPGHPPLDPRFPDRTRFHGPVLTRMMKLSVRYEYLYILAYHSTPLSEASRSKMDPATKEGITSLQIFSSYMSSLSAHSHLIPLFVTPHPEKVAKTIFAMARRHMSAFQSINLSRAPAWDRAKDNEITSQVHRLITEHETRWEWFLRGLGFNPFAARLILAILEAREQNTAADGTARSALHVFLDMDPKRILYEFRRFVGRDVINRVCGAVGVAT
ncbi:hypothetical protein N7492_001757 [Penicillium capsulatum]|uniref:Uncharacterized protein n=1 Tax=Penicillium capsulatum TaxID=69766 RepID=A0A9W9IYD5_9EURO|nr:hypothetical protein N7492_001757 [Penicillium capsulatum]KAJ6129193.1 hypothetical protein N7512_001973 [Penicillium capsulatum]